jgi:hypothetical protein
MNRGPFPLAWLDHVIRRSKFMFILIVIGLFYLTRKHGFYCSAPFSSHLIVRI